MKVKVVSKILESNERIAEENRRVFDINDVYAINLMSSPGAGKTTLLERTVELLKGEKGIGVIEGDIMGSDDAERLNRLGVPVVQINTGGACHLDANMINEVLDDLPLEQIDILFIENVGNLVCPAEFNVGENSKVMILAITEGDDKPLKYPLMFQQSGVLLLNKLDLAPYLSVDIEKIERHVTLLNKEIEIFKCSAKTGVGLDNWANWLNQRLA
ncbi:hydrogenase isoenzymes nickel incorporation protein HypB [bacterium BMS3Abin07]|nr:hydrogenase isoenzymes nickel incorporation protein HypB [bacterium BMS3Abin07]GBE32093.1 hydrogenase isoenzymes nickel incorporation protein HypB [bacterium BMS3Bbin05]HDO22840.1 hydrogenase accessory protein HypB [Nitrospirota bacterium]HDZ88105.1 hydrogenase accessory protein HypB [Nitrospirota bacterium]